MIETQAKSVGSNHEKQKQQNCIMKSNADRKGIELGQRQDEYQKMAQQVAG
jgi:hypothetical protein